MPTLRVQDPTQGNLVEFGTMLRDMGLGATEARGVVEEIQGIVNSAVMAAVPKMMARIQGVHRERLMLLHQRIRMQSSVMGMISRDMVLALILQTMSETPRS